MGAQHLLHALHVRGALVSLTPDGKIRVEAPEGTLDDRLRDQIRREREGLIALLQTFTRDEDRSCQCASFASAAFASSSLPILLRTMRTQKPQVCNPDLAGHDKFRSGALVPVPSGLPDEWRSGLEQLAPMPPPTGFGDARWALSVWQARQIARDHGPAAFVMGWDAEDLFGLHPAAPAARYDSMGLAFLLRKADCIVSLNDERAIIRHASGSTTTFGLGRCSPESRPAWELSGTLEDPGGSSARDLRPRGAG